MCILGAQHNGSHTRYKVQSYNVQNVRIKIESAFEIRREKECVQLVGCRNARNPGLAAHRTIPHTSSASSLPWPTAPTRGLGEAGQTRGGERRKRTAGALPTTSQPSRATHRVGKRRIITHRHSTRQDGGIEKCGLLYARHRGRGRGGQAATTGEEVLVRSTSRGRRPLGWLAGWWLHGGLCGVRAAAAEPGTLAVVSETGSC